MKKGSKKENRKGIMYRVRVDNETDRKCVEVSNTEQISKSEVIRQGIELKYENMKRSEKNVEM